MSGADRKRIVVLASGEGSVAQSLFDSVTKVDGALHKKLFISAVITAPGLWREQKHLASRAQ